MTLYLFSLGAVWVGAVSVVGLGIHFYQGRD